MSVQTTEIIEDESYDSDYSELDEDDDGDDGYYNDLDYYGSDDASNDSAMIVDELDKDPEYFDYKLMDINGAGLFLQENVNIVSKACDVTIGRARNALKDERWIVNNAVNSLKRSSAHLTSNNNDSVDSYAVKKRRMSCEYECPVCFMSVDETRVKTLGLCGHSFCSECWDAHFQMQIQSGAVSKVSCMQDKCACQVPEEFVMECLDDEQMKSRFQELTMIEYVVSHPELRFCPGVDCQVVVQADLPSARRVNCEECKSSFCFTCGGNYHAPVDCSSMKTWTQKLEDDSETANYMVANTKDCPKCNVCIEKSGGCNHIQCYKCQYDFCWMCLGDWSSHGSSYYECSKYKENPNLDKEKSKSDARTSLEKYLHYFQRWENHAKSLKLEDETRQKIQEHINEKVMQSVGTWIDWQYLLDAGELLKKCRYTLQYSYPGAYYMENESHKGCFEHLQGQLEAEVENLSWKVERAEITDRGDLERQMDFVEKRRVAMLRDSLDQ